MSFKAFRIIIASLSLKSTWFPTIFFLEPITLCSDVLFPHGRNLRKNTSVLGDTVLEILNQN